MEVGAGGKGAGVLWWWEEWEEGLGRVVVVVVLLSQHWLPLPRPLL